MSISIGSGSFGSSFDGDKLKTTNTEVNTDKLKTKLDSTEVGKVSDEELMETCKEFESYLVEQVYKAMEKTISKEEDEESDSSYMDYFGDNLSQEYAEKVSGSSNLGIAQILFDSMKKDI